MQGSISENIRKAFFEKIWGIFLMLELESSISGKIRKYNNFFSIWARKFHFQWIIFSLFGFGMENAGFRLREYKEFFNI